MSQREGLKKNSINFQLGTVKPPVQVWDCKLKLSWSELAGHNYGPHRNDMQYESGDVN